MGKQAGRIHPPAPGSPLSREYQALLDQRSRLADDNRANHELLQALKEEGRRAREAQAQLAAALDAWAKLEHRQAEADEARAERLRKQSRVVMREVIAVELKPFRDRLREDARQVKDYYKKVLEEIYGIQQSVSQHMAEILGFADINVFMAELTAEVTAAIIADLDEQREKNGLPPIDHAYIGEFLKRTTSRKPDPNSRQDRARG